MVVTSAPALPFRSRAAVGLGRTVRAASRRSGLGEGSVIGGRAALVADPALLARLGWWRRTTLVSGTNGKTTTNHLLAAALAAAEPGSSVAANLEGANMAPGVVAALAADPTAPLAALEVDERWLGHVLERLGPCAVVLLNLSRDQLDRTQEVRRVADGWRSALATLPTRHVVASADDPLVVWAAQRAANPVWVGTGAWWTQDAVGCPACAGRIRFAEGDSDGGWRCDDCGFARPARAVWIDGDDVVWADGRRVRLELTLPGRANAANAAMVLATVTADGAPPQQVAAALASVQEVAGRYRTTTVAGHRVRMLLAKNPAGWQEALQMLAPAVPVVTSINARIADGRDPSWLWDVPFEQLRGRFVVATGERRHDLAVRLAYAGVQHTTAQSLREAVQIATTPGSHGPGERPTGQVAADVIEHDPPVRTTTSLTVRVPDVELIANYTAFQDYLDDVGRHGSAEVPR
ncbi:MAG: DUF1727 domain-containing protein [Acidimicrobiia bacterium]|nr:DUF1727 domain-containing protein [Acidimicrobiia bacterium]